MFSYIIWSLIQVLIVLIRSRNRNDKLDLSQQQWIEVLDLATEWRFNVIRKLALGRIQDLGLDPIHQLELAQRFHVSSWFVDGWKALVLDANLMSLKDAECVGLRVAFELCSLRERLHANALNKEDLEGELRAVFAPALEGLNAHLYHTKEERLALEEVKRTQEEERQRMALAEAEAEMTRRKEELAAELEKEIREKQEKLALLENLDKGLPEPEPTTVTDNDESVCYTSFIVWSDQL